MVLQTITGQDIHQRSYSLCDVNGVFYKRLEGICCWRILEGALLDLVAQKIRRSCTYKILITSGGTLCAVWVARGNSHFTGGASRINI